MRKEWNHSEIYILRENYSIKSRKEMKQLLPNRTAASINHQASRLKLPKSSWFWSNEELEILRTNWSNSGRQKILSLLPLKDWTSIRHKAFDLGLKKEGLRARYSHTYTEAPTVVLTDKQIGYFAGIIDGEGHIRIVRSRENGHEYYAPLIGITNTDRALIEKCMQIFRSGQFYIKERASPKHKTTYVYVIASVKGVKQILTQIIDDLVTKKKRAEIVLEFIKVKEAKMTLGVDQKEIELYDKMTHLNERGNGESKTSV